MSTLPAALSPRCLATCDTINFASFDFLAHDSGRAVYLVPQNNLMFALYPRDLRQLAATLLFVAEKLDDEVIQKNTPPDDDDDDLSGAQVLLPLPNKAARGMDRVSTLIRKGGTA